MASATAWMDSLRSASSVSLMVANEPSHEFGSPWIGRDSRQSRAKETVQLLLVVRRSVDRSSSGPWVVENLLSRLFT